MMNHIVSAVTVLVCIMLGGFGAHFLKAQPASASATHAEKEDKGHADAGDSHAAKPEKDDSHSKHGASSASGSSETFYYKFSREFVVPIMENSKVKSLVIINLNLEADASISSELFAMEPKLRDNIMTTLIGLSAEGTALDNITEAESYETIRSMILTNIGKLVSTGVNNVLILDIAKQDL